MISAALISKVWSSCNALRDAAANNGDYLDNQHVPPWGFQNFEPPPTGVAARKCLGHKKRRNVFLHISPFFILEPYVSLYRKRSSAATSAGGIRIVKGKPACI